MNSAHLNVSDRRMDRGAVLMVVLLVMIALLGLGMTGLFLTSGSIQMNANITLRNQALAVAEAGIERARDVLNNKNWNPPIPSMLAAFDAPNTFDEIPQNATDTSSCRGELRGAVLVDRITTNCSSSPWCPLRDVPFPYSVNRTTDLPSTDLSVSRPTMGTYTVYIRQDPADCRMGNFTCEYASVDTSTTTTTTTGTEVATATLTSVPCAPPVGTPMPNGALVVRSEGVAVDGKTRVVLEVTMTPSQGAAQAANTPLSALCANGAAGCDDNASVQNGIVVNSTNPLTPPPPPPPPTDTNTGTGTSSGTTSTTSTGTPTDTGTITLTDTNSGTSTSTATSTSTGTSTGTSTSTSTTTATNTNTDTCVGSRCSQVGYLGEFGMWDPNVKSDLFIGWLKSNYPECAAEGQQLVFQTPSGGKTRNTYNDLKITAARLKGYTALVLLDMYHSYIDRVNCTRNSNIDQCNTLECYLPSGNDHVCKGVFSSATQTSTSTDPYVVSGCPRTATLTGTVTSVYTSTGTHTATVAHRDFPGHLHTGTGTFTQNTTGSGVKTNVTFRADCTTTPANDRLTSYNYSTGRVLESDEIAALQAWIEAGHGLVTTSSYYGFAAETANVNAIISKYGIKYATTDQAGHIASVLGGTWDATHGGGCDVGSMYNFGANDFKNTVEPLRHQDSGYPVKTVLGLQVRSGVPIVSNWYSPGNAFGAYMPTNCILNVKQSCPLLISTPCTGALPCAADSMLPACLGAVVDGGAAVSGRVVAWADEWITYDAVWGSLGTCSNRWQAGVFWENVVRWLGRCN